MSSRKQIGEKLATIQMDTVTDSFLKARHKQTTKTFIRFFFFTVKSIQINKVLGQQRTIKKHGKGL